MRHEALRPGAGARSLFVLESMIVCGKVGARWRAEEGSLCVDTASCWRGYLWERV